MTVTWPPFAGWLLHSAVGGGMLLLLALPLMRACRQPARRQRLGESALLAALALCVLNLGPSWITLPLLRPEPASLPVVRPEPSLAFKQPAENDAGYEREAGETEISALPEDATALVLSMLKATSGDGDAAAGDSTEMIPQSESRAPDSGPGIAFSWPSLNLSRWLPLLAIAYAAASVFLLGRWLLGHCVLWRLLNDAQPAPEAIYQLFETMTRGQGRRPRLLVSKRLRVPLSCGLIRPCVVVPASFCEPNAAGALRWLFAHELTHLERGDAWTCLLFGLGQALYFCLPWFWWLRRQVRLCQEYVADAAAVEQAANPEDYAQFLVSLTRAPAVPLGALGVLGNSSDLFRRVTMLLQSPIRVEKRCPRWWSLATAGSLLGLALLVSGIGLRADAAGGQSDKQTVIAVADDDSEPADKPKDAKKARKVIVIEDDESADKQDSKKKPAVEKVLRDLEELLKDLPSAVDADKVKQLQEQLKKSEKEMERALDNLKKDSGKFDVLKKHLIELHSGDVLFNGDVHRKALEALGGGGEFLLERDGNRLVVRRGGGRLGVQVQKPGSVLADQLDLPKDQGLVIEHVLPDSAAAKAGLKAHDVLLEFNGKPVPNEVAKFIKLLEEVKANTPVDAVVLRKGKKETIKGISLAEAKAKQEMRLNFDVRPHTVIEGGDRKHSVTTTISRSKDSFTARHQEDSLTITVTGSVSDGKGKVKQIEIRDGGKSETYESVDKVPEQYRSKVKNLIEMSEKGNLKIEVGVNVAPNGVKETNIVGRWKLGPFKHSKAKDVYLFIKDAYREHINSGRNQDLNQIRLNESLGQNDPRGVNLSVTYDDRTNAIYLSCNQALYEKIKTLVDEFENKKVDPSKDGADAYQTQQGKTATITFEKGNAAAVAQAVSRMLPQLRRNPIRLAIPGLETVRIGSVDGSSPGDPNISVTLTAFGNKLRVDCEDQQALDLVRELSRLLTTDPRDGDFEIIKLKTARATDAIKTLDEAFNGNKRADGTIRAVADANSNSILVRAQPLDMLTIRKMVEEFIDKGK